MASYEWHEKCAQCGLEVDVVTYDKLIRLTHDWVTYILCGWQCASLFTSDKVFATDLDSLLAEINNPYGNTGVLFNSEATK